MARRLVRSSAVLPLLLVAGSAPSPNGVFAMGASVSGGGLEAFR